MNASRGWRHSAIFFLCVAMLVVVSPGTTAMTSAVTTGTPGRVADVQATRIVTVNPARLPRGPRPRVAFLRTGRRTIQDGAFRRTAMVAGRPGTLLEVRDGYLLTSRRSAISGGPVTITYFPRRGPKRVLTRQASTDPRAVSVSADRRKVVYVVQPGVTQLRTEVKRISDGAVVAQRRFARVLLLAGPRNGRLLVNDGSVTVWWRPGRPQLQHVLTSEGVMDADVSAGQIAHVPDGGSNTRVIRFPRLPGPAWEVGGNEGSFVWSPDDRWVIGMAGFISDGQFSAHPLIRVRRASTGTRRGVVFEGAFTRRRGELPDAVWENNRTFLVVAMTPPNAAGDRRRAVVRCSLSGQCERVSRLYDQVNVPYVLATASTS